MTELVFRLTCDTQVLGPNVLGRSPGSPTAATIAVVTRCVALLAVLTRAWSRGAPAARPG
jgi:hypothetical protein